MARTPGQIEDIARNHHVEVNHGPPLMVKCRRCGYEWEAPTTETGKETKNFFLCLDKFCNLSDGEALRVLGRDKAGVEQDPELVAAARDRIVMTAEASHFKGRRIVEAAREIDKPRTSHARDTPPKQERQEAPPKISDDLRDALFEHFTIKPMNLDRLRKARVKIAQDAAGKVNCKLVVNKGTFYLVTPKGRYTSKRKLIAHFQTIQAVEDHLGIKRDLLDPVAGDSINSRIERCRTLARRNRWDVEQIPVGKLKGRFVLRRWKPQEMHYVPEKFWKTTSQRVIDKTFSLEELEFFLGWDVDAYIEQALALAAGTAAGAPVAPVDDLTMGGGAVNLDDLLQERTT